MKKTSTIHCVYQSVSGPHEESSHEIPLHILEYVALLVSGGDLKGQGSVVTLQYGRVVVQYGQFTSCITQEGVCPPWMIDIMYCSSDKRCHLIYRVQTLLRMRQMQRMIPAAAIPRKRVDQTSACSPSRAPCAGSMRWRAARLRRVWSCGRSYWSDSWLR